MTKFFQLRKSITFLCLASLLAVSAAAILTHGQLGSRIADALRYGDIPPSNNCVSIVTDGNGISTADVVSQQAQIIASHPQNVPQLVSAATERFGPTIDGTEFAKLCASIDGRQIATLNDVNLGRR